MIDRTKWREEVRSRLIPETRAWGLEAWDGWRDLICDLIDRIEGAGVRCQLFEVKEKFGGLCFYMADDVDDPIAQWIEETENKSFSICEKCGNSGTETVSGGWAKTLCQPCFKRWDEESWRGAPRATE